MTLIIEILGGVDQKLNLTLVFMAICQSIQSMINPQLAQSGSTTFLWRNPFLIFCAFSVSRIVDSSWV